MTEEPANTRSDYPHRSGAGVELRIRFIRAFEWRLRSNHTLYMYTNDQTSGCDVEMKWMI